MSELALVPWKALAIASAALSAAGMVLALAHWRQQSQALARAMGLRLTASQGKLALRQALTDAWRQCADGLERRLPRAMAKGLTGRLEQAGWPGVTSGGLLLRAAVWGLAGMALGLFLDLGWSAAPLALTGLLPLFQLQDAVARRRRALRKALPDALDLLTACVQAGLGLEQAMVRVVERLEPGPLRTDWQWALAGMRVGQSRREAFRALEARMGLEEMSQVVGSLLQAELRGVALAPALKAQAAQMRRLKALRVQKAAAEAPLKMLFPLMAFILPVVFLVLFGPILLQWSGLGL